MPKPRPVRLAVFKKLAAKRNIKMNIGSKINTDNFKSYSGDQHAIAIIQPGSLGDNFNSTLMLKPIKAKWPNAIIDIYTSTKYASAFHENPLINNTIEIQSYDKNSSLNLVHVIPPLLENRGYTKIYNPHPMINPDKWTSLKHNDIGVNLICAWIRTLEHDDIDYNWPLETILRLNDGETHKVDDFWNVVPKNCRNILIEAGHESGQSYFTEAWLFKICKYLLDGNTNIYISRASDENVNTINDFSPGHVYFVGSLSVRECAHLFNKCDAFFSVSSGLSNACNTNWCKKDIKWFEAINSEAVSSAPIRKEGKNFWFKDDLDGYIEFIKSHGL
jgi:hypothetical protein